MCQAVPKRCSIGIGTSGRCPGHMVWAMLGSGHWPRVDVPQISSPSSAGPYFTSLTFPLPCGVSNSGPWRERMELTAGRSNLHTDHWPQRPRAGAEFHILLGLLNSTAPPTAAHIEMKQSRGSAGVVGAICRQILMTSDGHWAADLVEAAITHTSSERSVVHGAWPCIPRASLTPTEVNQTYSVAPLT